MKRELKIRVRSNEVSVSLSANITTKHLADYEADKIKGVLADGIMQTLTRLPYSGFYLHEVEVK